MAFDVDVESCMSFLVTFVVRMQSLQCLAGYLLGNGVRLLFAHNQVATMRMTYQATKCALCLSSL